MKRFIPILIISVTLFLAACASPQANPQPVTSIPSAVSSSTAGASASNPDDISRTESQGAVTVKITPLNLDKPGDTLNFDVSMNTHSVDLSMDLTTLATLTTDTGLSIQAAKWEAPGGGHHTDGTLSFPAMKDGKSILDGAKQLTLTISKIDNATGIFTWDLSAK
jgi:hypothetical protein